MPRPSFRKSALQKFPLQQSLDFETKPLDSLQQYLRQAKISIVLLRDCLVELKELIVLVGLMTFFVWGMIDFFLSIYR